MSSLRRLDVDQQVALLFVVLFGLLLLVTTVAVIASLRRDDNDARHEQIKRDLRALWVGTTLFWLAWLAGPLGATLTFGVISFLALREFITLAHTRRSDHRGLLLAFFVVLPI